MLGLNVYKVISFILLPIAALLGISCFLGFFVAIANPAGLLPICMILCAVIYIFASFSFLQKGIIKTKPCNHSLKDWIKVNAYVSVVLGFMLLLDFIQIAAQPHLLTQAIQVFQTQAATMQKTMPPDAAKMQAATLQKMPAILKGMVYFMIVFAALLLTHIGFTFTYLKKYNHLFIEV
ncbi:hypothetical protein [Parasediminibacterium sp. JCM 36343]|uniref:hypothetical protein n=1 Tax=Parasediminibacterium sp. JCM 36343 TaxID=3374279 RepID=UPI00397C39A4